MLLEPEDINPAMDTYDVAIVIGAMMWLILSATGKEPLVVQQVECQMGIEVPTMRKCGGLS
ncbi:MAG: hypothetical protein CM15mP104_3070 [Gammaproteobacteria bacterium]|nr:MAG: hypothetical protein CM15mP104_3070 [Gammaproteobacteria bacterium]